MKNIIYILVCLLMLQSCNTKEDHFTVYVDPSLSEQIDRTVLTKYFRQELAEYLTDDNNATVELKLLSHTTSIANSKVFQYAPPKYEDFIFSDETKILRWEMYQSQVAQYKQSFIDTLVNAVCTIQISTTSTETEIIEVLVPFSKFQHSSKVFLISDMIQKSEIVDLTTENIVHESQIIELAKRSKALLKEKFILPDAFYYGIEIVCLIPVKQDTDNSLYPYLETYFRTYFKSFDGINIKFQRL